MTVDKFYIGQNAPKSSNVLWLRPLQVGGVALYVHALGRWNTLKLMDSKGTLSPMDDEPIDVSGDSDHYYTKEELDDRFADMLGIDAKGISDLKALIEDGDTTTGLLGEIQDKASLSKTNTFTKKCVFQGNYTTDTVTIGGSISGNDMMSIVSSGRGITFDGNNTLIEGIYGTTKWAGIHFGDDGLYEWAPGYTSYKRIALKEDVESKTAVTTTTETTITPTLNSCYSWTSAVSTLSVELNSGMGNYIGAVTLIFTTGSTTPSISFDNGTGTVYYQSGITFEASTSYEVNCLWVGDKWIVAVNKLVTTLGG